MKSLDYWANRKAQQMYEEMAEAEKAADEIERLYLSASGYIQSEAKHIFDKFRDKRRLTDKEAMLLLRTVNIPRDPGELIRYLRSLTFTDPERQQQLIEWLAAPAARSRLNNLANLQGQLDQMFMVLYVQELGMQRELYQKIAEDAYLKSIFDMQQYAGYGFDVKVLSAENVNRILQERWSGKNFSQRLWDNTEELARRVRQELLVAFLTGRSQKKTWEALDQVFQKGNFNTRRLVRTESNYVANQVQAEAYTRMGVEKYIYVAILDLRTSKACQALDKKRFPVAEAMPGKNFPPMHPWCRSTTIADMPDEVLRKMKQTAYNPRTGRHTTVSGDMTYKEWHKRFVEDVLPENLSQPVKTRDLDYVQYEKYKEIFKKDFPESFEKFKEMKYNDDEKWSEYKGSKQEELNKLDLDETEGLHGKLGNIEVRRWYTARNNEIPNLIDSKASIEEKAKQAFDLRNSYKFEAREMMMDQKARRALGRNDPLDTDFESLISLKMGRKGLSREEAIADIYKTATKTRKSVNVRYGVE